MPFLYNFFTDRYEQDTAMYNFATGQHDPLTVDQIQTDAQALRYLPQNPAAWAAYHRLRDAGNSIPDALRLTTLALITVQEQ